ncbi:restriction endonuclease subunit S, partial [Slackia isoflavoniconvertens]|uniref:restriction endonuclease subunit S n=1 Tax=Slackia isoflavoniconvertens TaxID=572010 RepID=UPI003F995FB0
MQAGKNIAASNISSTPDHQHQYPCFGGNGIRGYVAQSNRSGDYPLIGRQGALCGNVNRATGDFYATEHAVVASVFADMSVDWSCEMLTALDLNQYATATAQPGLAVSKISEVLSPVPPVTEQQRIVEALAQLVSRVDEYGALEDEREQLDAELPDRLRKSILQMAVQGKLVPQDPNDEPASVLLERIREERAVLIKEKKLKAPKGGESVIYRGSDGGYYEKRGNGEPVCIDDEIPFEIPESWEWA